MYQLQKTLIEIIKSNHKVSPQETEEGAWMKVELCKWDDWEEIEEGNLMLLEKKSDNKNYNQAENQKNHGTTMTMNCNFKYQNGKVNQRGREEG